MTLKTEDERLISSVPAEPRSAKSRTYNKGRLATVVMIGLFLGLVLIGGWAVIKPAPSSSSTCALPQSTRSTLASSSNLVFSNVASKQIANGCLSHSEAVFLLRVSQENFKISIGDFNNGSIDVFEIDGRAVAENDPLTRNFLTWVDNLAPSQRPTSSSVASQRLRLHF